MLLKQGPHKIKEHQQLKIAYICLPGQILIELGFSREDNLSSIPLERDLCQTSLLQNVAIVREVDIGSSKILLKRKKKTNQPKIELKLNAWPVTEPDGVATAKVITKGMSMTTEIAKMESHSKQMTYFPTELEWKFMVSWGTQAIRSGMLPAGIKSPEAAAIVILKGRELGLPFMTSVAHIHVINGKPSMSAELLQGLARKNLPGLVINILKSDSKIAEIEFIRPEKGSKAFVQSFTMDEAIAAKLNSKDVWKSYPAAMLWSRCVSAGLRKVCPEALMGISYTPEELGAEVDRDGNVIETTSREILETKDAPIIPITPKPISPKPEIDPDIAAKKAEGQKIKLLREELHLTHEEVLADVHRLFKKEGFTSLTLAEMIEVREVLQEELDLRKNEKTVDPKNEEPQ